MKIGIYDWTNELYHSSSAISRSSLMEFKKSPRHYWHKYINPSYVKKAPSADMTLGSALHCVLLEPEEFYNRYAIEEKIDKRSNEGKKAYAAMLEKNAGKTVLDKETKQQIDAMSEAIYNDYKARELITNARYEKSFIWQDKDTGIWCKARPDIWHDNFIVDYKSQKSATEYDFQRALFYDGYYIQAAMISEAFKNVLDIDMRQFVYLVQEKTEPYLPVIYQLDPLALEYGINEFKKLLERLKYCYDTNSWPGYDNKLITLPNWSI